MVKSIIATLQLPNPKYSLTTITKKQLGEDSKVGEYFKMAATYEKHKVINCMIKVRGLTRESQALISV